MTQQPREPRDIVDEYERILRRELRFIPEEERRAFLDSMNRELSGLSKVIYKKMGLGHTTTTTYPKWMYTYSAGRIKTKKGKEIEIRRTSRPDINPPIYLDHFAKAKIITESRTDEGKWKYVSNPYRLTSEVLEVMIDEMKKRGVRFDISGESNYNPGRTFQIRFERRNP